MLQKEVWSWRSSSFAGEPGLRVVGVRRKHPSLHPKNPSRKKLLCTLVTSQVASDTQLAWCPGAKLRRSQGGPGRMPSGVQAPESGLLPGEPRGLAVPRDPGSPDTCAELRWRRGPPQEGSRAG